MSKENKNLRTNDPRTYEDYVDLGKVNTKGYLMLSELIDNSISSFDTEYGEGKWRKKLEIEININNPKVDTATFANTKYFPNSYIEVKDNAFGIKPDDLINTLKLNKKNKNNSSKMNVHGRGLKQSAFYFGLGVEVISRYKDESKTFSVDNRPIKKGISNYVEYEVVESKKKRDVGTTIRIESLRESHKFTPKRLQDALEALSYRYSKLVSSEQMSITIKHKLDDSGKFKKSVINETMDDVARLREDYGEYSIEERKRITIAAKRKVDELIEKASEKRNIYKYPELAKKTSQKISKIIRSEDLETQFKWTEKIIVNSKETVMMDFWLLSTKTNSKDKKAKRGYAQKRGIRVNEGDRAILHPPILKNELSTYLDPLPSSNRTGAVDNRFVGEVNISNFSAQTTTDKSTFEFKAQEDKERFDDQISVIFDVFEQFVLKGRSGNKTSEAAKFTAADDNKIEATITSKFPKQVKTIGFDNEIRNSITAKIIFKGEEFKLKVKIDSRNTPTKILTTKVNNDKNTVDAIWFNNHNIWKNINTESKSFNIESMVPLFLLLVFQEMNFKDKIKYIKEKLRDENSKKLDSLSEDSLNEASKDIE